VRWLGIVLALTVAGSSAHARQITFVGVSGSPASPPGTNVFAVNADGTGLRELVPGAINPRWSPDGSHLVYTALVNGSNNAVSPGGLFVASADGSQQTRLTGGNDAAVGWSADGGWIAFRRSEQGRQDLFVVHADGSGAREVIAGSGGASWAADSKHLLIAPHGGLDLVDLAGHARRIPHTACNGGDGTISPNGRWLAFARCIGFPQRTGLAIEHLDGSGLRWLTRPINPGGSWNPAWSPDSTKLAYTSERSEGDLDHSEIRMVSIAGKQLGNLDSYAQDHDEYAQWSPDGTQIVFDRDAALEPIGESDRLYVGDVKTGRVRQLYEFIARGDQSWRPR
jgi:TolB protein